MKASFDKIQEAFVEGRISLKELIEILIDNFGEKKTQKILSHNIELAIEKEEKHGRADKKR